MSDEQSARAGPGQLSASALRDLEANIRKFYVYRFIENLYLWLPIWVLYLQRQRGLSLGQIAALDAPFWLVSVLAEVPTGAFADRFGRRTSLVLGNLLLGGSFLVFGLASSYAVILASYIIWAIGMAFQSGADLALLYDDLVALGRAAEYPKAAGRSFGITAAASIVALLAGAKLAELTQLNVPVLASAGACVLAAAVAWRLRESPHLLTAQRPRLLTTVRLGLSEAWREPRLRYMLGFTAALRAASMAPVLFVQPFLAHYGVPVGRYGLLQTPARLASIVAALYAYRLITRLSERRLILATPLWACLCFLLLAAWGNAWAFIAFPLFALGFAASNPLLSDYLNRHTRPDQRATVLSVGQLVGSIILIGLEPGLGAIAQAAGLQAAFLATAAFVALTTLATLGPWALLSSESAQSEPAARA